MTQKSSRAAVSGTLLVRNFTGSPITIVGTVKFPGQSQAAPFTLECTPEIEFQRLGETAKHFNRAVSEIRITGFKLTAAKPK
jgi:hypothetical protein